MEKSCKKCEHLVEKVLGSGKDRITVFVHAGNQHTFDSMINKCIEIQAEQKADQIFRKKLADGIAKLLNYIEK